MGLEETFRFPARFIRYGAYVAWILIRVGRFNGHFRLVGVSHGIVDTVAVDNWPEYMFTFLHCCLVIFGAWYPESAWEGGVANNGVINEGLVCRAVGGTLHFG